MASPAEEAMFITFPAIELDLLDPGRQVAICNPACIAAAVATMHLLQLQLFTPAFFVSVCKWQVNYIGSHSKVGKSVVKINARDINYFSK